MIADVCRVHLFAVVSSAYDAKVHICSNVRAAMMVLLISYPISQAKAGSKPHVIAFGKWAVVKHMTGPDEDKSSDMRVRPLYVDGKTREFVLGTVHDVTDRLLVVRRAFRLNDALPDETSVVPRWKWELGGWLLIDRVSGHISQLALPDFDFDNSTASWYRDYVAYCGTSSDSNKVYALVGQLGRRKPVLKKALQENGDGLVKSECRSTWQRQPARVTFTIGPNQKVTYGIRGSVADVVTEDDEDESETE